MSREQREPEVIANIRTRVEWLENETVLIGLQAHELTEKCAILDAYDCCRAQLAAAERRAEYWKAELNAANAENDLLRTRAERAEAASIGVVAKYIAARDCNGELCGAGKASHVLPEFCTCRREAKHEIDAALSTTPTNRGA